MLSKLGYPIKRSAVVQPFNDMFEEIFDRMEKMDLDFSKPFKLLEGVKSKIYTKLNIYSKDDVLNVEATVPGLTKDDVKVTLDSETNVLTISGQSSHDKNVNEDDYHVREITRSAFSRSLQLPDDLKAEDVDKMKASFKDGILKIQIPYKEVTKKVKTIDIE